MNYKLLYKRRLCKSAVQQISVVWKGYNSRLMALKGKQGLTSIEFWTTQMPNSNTKTSNDIALRL